jgi:hypothetical protein
MLGGCLRLFIVLRAFLVLSQPTVQVAAERIETIRRRTEVRPGALYFELFSAQASEQLMGSPLGRAVARSDGVCRYFAYFPMRAEEVGAVLRAGVQNPAGKGRIPYSTFQIQAPVPRALHVPIRLRGAVGRVGMGHGSGP